MKEQNLIPYLICTFADGTMLVIMRLDEQEEFTEVMHRTLALAKDVARQLYGSEAHALSMLVLRLDQASAQALALQIASSHDVHE